jgi:hypothetical protein
MAQPKRLRRQGGRRAVLIRHPGGSPDVPGRAGRNPQAAYFVALIVDPARVVETAVESSSVWTNGRSAASPAPRPALTSVWLSRRGAVALCVPRAVLRHEAPYD